jgi:hypothetical protein
MLAVPQPGSVREWLGLPSDQTLNNLLKKHGIFD